MKGQSNTEAQTCSICHQRYEGSGHIAAPVKGGRCCNRCNDRYVIPLKIKKMRNEERNKSPDPKSGLFEVDP
jgi:hypothetical protein